MDTGIVLIEELDKFKAVTLELVGLLEQDKIDDLEALMDKRQRIIDDINTCQYTKEEFIEISSNLKLKELEIRLNSLMLTKKNEAKGTLDNFIKGKNVNRNYNSKFAVDSLFLNKKY